MRFLWGFPILLFWLAAGCAQIKAPSGGDRDQTPPQVKKASPPSLTTSFSSSLITLEFDEYIQLNDPYNQIIVSPPLDERPEFTLKKKSLIIDLKDQQLRPNTTYTIQLGQAVQDYNERNPAGDLSYVFATGPELDSAFVNGRVYDALDLKALGKAKVMLYQHPLDSAYLENRPDYFAMSDEGGNFTIKNLPAGSFQVIALVEENANYIYDEPGIEKVGFSIDAVSSITKAVPDSLSEPQFVDDSLATPLPPTVEKLSIPLFREEGLVFIQESNRDKTGFATIGFNRVVEEVEVKALENPDQLLQEHKEDSLYLQWIGDLGKHRVEIKWDTLVLDTIKLNLEEDAEESLAFLGLRENNLAPEDTLFLEFNRFLSKVSSADFKVIQDSIPLQVNAETTGRALAVPGPWVEGSAYKMEFPPTAVEAYGAALSDTVRTNFETIAPSEYGRLIINISTDFDDPYVLQILKNGEIELEFVGKGEGQADFAKLLPGTRELRLIQDTNGDGKWTTGSFELQIPPERIFLFEEKMEIRSRWEQDIDWSINASKAQP